MTKNNKMQISESDFMGLHMKATFHAMSVDKDSQAKLTVTIPMEYRNTVLACGSLTNKEIHVVIKKEGEADHLVGLFFQAIIHSLKVDHVGSSKLALDVAPEHKNTVLTCGYLTNQVLDLYIKPAEQGKVRF